MLGPGSRSAPGPRRHPAAWRGVLPRALSTGSGAKRAAPTAKPRPFASRRAGCTSLRARKTLRLPQPCPIELGRRVGEAGIHEAAWRGLEGVCGEGNPVRQVRCGRDDHGLTDQTGEVEAELAAGESKATVGRENERRHARVHGQVGFDEPTRVVVAGTRDEAARANNARGQQRQPAKFPAPGDARAGAEQAPSREVGGKLKCRAPDFGAGAAALPGELRAVAANVLRGGSVGLSRAMRLRGWAAIGVKSPASTMAPFARAAVP